MTERSVGSYSTSEEIEHEIRRVQEELTEAKYLQENLTLVHGLARDVLQHIQQDRSRSRPNAYQRAANICGAASCACAPPQQCHQMCISPQMYQQFVNDAGAYIRNMGNNSTTPSHNIVDSGKTSYFKFNYNAEIETTKGNSFFFFFGHPLKFSSALRLCWIYSVWIHYCSCKSSIRWKRTNT